MVLSHALGCDSSMYSQLAALLAPRFDVIVYDHRGHGRSPAPPGPYTIEQMAGDAAALIAKLCAGGPVHFVGSSLGGMVAQSLAARHPSLLQSITVANSCMHYGEEARALWPARIAAVAAGGLAAISEGAMGRWFTPAFRQSQVAQVANCRRVLENSDMAGYMASCGAVMNIDFRTSNMTAQCPALVIAGDRDEATPPALSEDIAQALPHSQLRSLNAAHLSVMEQPDAFAKLLVAFLDQNI